MQNAPINIEEYEKIQPVAELRSGGNVALFAVPNTHTLWRANTLRDKEPDTMAWIEGFAPNDVLIDIGANVGMYTIWAAKIRGARVFAFEPESQNFALLNRNIFLNQLCGLVRAYPVALSDTEGFSDLHLSQFVGGGSCHSFGEQVDFNLQPCSSAFDQGAYATTLDRLIEQQVIPVPQHIKIDVDGIEHKVIKGCENLLKHPDLQTVLVELNTHLELHRNIIRIMEELGFGLSPEQLAIAMRTTGTFAGVGNHIFRRDLL